jgi:hypothetical protein
MSNIVQLTGKKPMTKETCMKLYDKLISVFGENDVRLAIEVICDGNMKTVDNQKDAEDTLDNIS